MIIAQSVKLKLTLALLLFSGFHATGAHATPPAPGNVTLLNVSYDPTKELYQSENASFASYWLKKLARRSPSTSRTVDRANRREPLSTASKLMSSPLPLPTTSMPSPTASCLPTTGSSVSPRTVPPTPRPSSSSCARETLKGSEAGMT